MLVYIGAFGLSVVLARLAEIKNSYKKNGYKNAESFPRKWNLPALLVAAVLITISALRWGVGSDYWNYHVIFPSYAREFSEDFSIFGEPGLRFFAWIGMQLNGDSATMFALAAIITIGLTIRTLWRWSPAFAFGVALYILIGAWSGSFNGVRQYLASAVLFAGHRYVIDRRLWKWIAVVFIAMLFHVSALVALLVYFVPTKRTSLGIQCVILLAGLIGMLSVGTLLESLTAVTGETRWDGSYANRSVNPLRIAFAFVPLALYWLLANKQAIRRQGSWFYVNMLAIYGATYLASATSALMARFVIYATPFTILGLIAVTSVGIRGDRFILRGFLLVLYALFFYFDTFVIGEAQEFQWLWERE